MALTKNCWDEPFVLRRFTLQEEDLTNTNEGCCEADVHFVTACSLGNCALEMTGYVYLTDQLNEVKEEFEEKAFQSHCSTFAPFLISQTYVRNAVTLHSTLRWMNANG